MIRREILATHSATRDLSTYAELAAAHVKRGESVRIVGLGTLAVVEAGCAGCSRCRASEGCTYRLTLTAAVAKACARGVMVETSSTEQASALALVPADVRHLARALGAPVEVRSPGRCARGGCGPDCGAPTFITTVTP